MKQFHIVSKQEIAEIEREVSDLLNEGWNLAGGLSMAYKHEHNESKHMPGHLVYAQAMVKEIS